MKVNDNFHLVCSLLSSINHIFVKKMLKCDLVALKLFTSHLQQTWKAATMKRPTFTKTSLSHVHHLCVHNKRKKGVKETIQFPSDGSCSGQIAMDWTHNRIKDHISKLPKSDWKDWIFLCSHCSEKLYHTYVTHRQKKLDFGLPSAMDLYSQYDPLFWPFDSLQPPLIGYCFPPSIFALLVK